MAVNCADADEQTKALDGVHTKERKDLDAYSGFAREPKTRGLRKSAPIEKEALTKATTIRYGIVMRKSGTEIQPSIMYGARSPKNGRARSAS